MALNTFGLKGPVNPVAWRDKPPSASIAPSAVVYGKDPGNMPIQFALAEWKGAGAPSREQLSKLHKARQGKTKATVVVAAVGPDRVWLTGPASDCAPIDLDRDQALRVMQEVLGEPDLLSARERFASLQKAVVAASHVGVVNEGLFASHYLETSVTHRADWVEATAEMLAARDGSDLGDLRHS